MSRVLFVSNGHGEAAIADRIAVELRALAPELEIDHLALVGDSASGAMREVGPRRAMPSGGLIAMGNVRNILRDVGAGLLGLLAAQRRFLRGARGEYAAAVAVGDAYALAMTLRARASTVFVGTAKSVSVAPYGPFERRLLARAVATFVRDDATVKALREQGVTVNPAANVIVDLFVTPSDDAAATAATEGFEPVLALFPGSREGAYDDAAFLLQAVRAVAARHPRLGAVLSVAPGLDAQRFLRDARREGWRGANGTTPEMPFVLSDGGRTLVRAWSASPGPLLSRVALLLGQAGTANEGAAAAGVPVVAFARERGGRARWYRRRQQGLLGDALLLLGGSLDEAVAGVCALLDDAPRRAAMGAAGRARMGPPGAARRIAQTVAVLARAS
ncbi:MAG TPA: hypothetical protein VGX91_02435 [Candidatus Cybelea sp.]|nr:hypothetical protein [Candidatus Cybelea sp.]